MPRKDDKNAENHTLVIPLSGDPKDHNDARDELHGFGIAGMVYANQLHRALRDSAGALWPDVQATAVGHTRSVIDSMKCRDPLEEMLVQQALWTHARVIHLTMLAQAQTDLHAIRIVNEACNRTSNTYRRLTLALAEKRRPRRSSQFTAIKQANVAAQQIVQNDSAAFIEENTSNELGCTDVNAQETTVSVDRDRPCLTEQVDPKDQAVDEIDGTEK